MFENSVLPMKKTNKFSEDNNQALLPLDCFSDIKPQTNEILRKTTCIREFLPERGDSFDAWKQHRPNQIAFKTSIERIKDALLEERFEAQVIPVCNYCHLGSVSIEAEHSTHSDISISDFLSQFSFKDRNYNREQAIRLVGMRKQAPNSDDAFDLRDAKYANLRATEGLAANLASLIKEVLISPYASDWNADMLEIYVKEDFDISVSVALSS